MSPLELQICLHYHSSPVDFPWCVAEPGAPIKPDVMSTLINEGLLNLGPFATTHGNMIYGPTNKLHAFVEMLCLTPFPKQAWTDPRTGEVIRKIG